MPQIVNALLSRHNFILLGLRGQAKSRILRALITLLDPEMPIIAISGVSFKGSNYLYAAARFGAFATLKKPFLLDDLKAMVDEATDAAKTARESPNLAPLVKGPQD